ncbi:protein spaetzle 4 isoform X2 [Belonocnema kinseyi]|uniref:protein spaetzle 4 isoform X2 n=1 Tax=Belonocnema kinseyi TaxID=2817044 RepID=UPI00143DBD19|nr:protein spaetzle 4 isoform X2 [Belonocnema kinseyi]
MKRMYGDERHINILKTELENNDVELEFEESYQRYPEDSRRFEYDEDLEYNNPRYLNIQKDMPEGRGFTSRALNIGNTKLNGNINKKFIKLGEYTKPHFYPSENPTSTSSTSTTTSTTAKSTNVTDQTSALSSASTTTTTTTRTTNTTVIPTTPPIKSSISTPNSTHLDINSTTNKSLNDNETLSTTPSVTLAEIVQIQNLSINEIPGQADRFELDVDELTEFPIVSDDEEESLEEMTTKFSNLGSIDRIDDVPEVIDEIESNDQIGAESEQQQEFRPRPEYRPSEIKNNGSSMEGQLYQDVAAKEQKQPIFKGQGVLACPVKEEVVAPFWANNTRGEVLALLNLYPFEQYVHWEKCTRPPEAGSAQQ